VFNAAAIQDEPVVKTLHPFVSCFRPSGMDQAAGSIFPRKGSVNVTAMFKSNPIENPGSDNAAEPALHVLGVVHHDSPARSPLSGSEQAMIGKDLVFHGEITGSESLYIDGKVEGSVNLPGSRVTVGRNGQVNASINAREIVVMGKVRGDVFATDRVDVRAEGALTGDVTAARISIEDGAFFKGGIDIRKAESKQARSVSISAPDVEELKEA
jgi:cytoskeletal protein CcmA (bactofilin family)